MLTTIWNIAWKEIKVNIRDTRTFLFMLAFPILLMLILGSALSNAFSSSAQLGDLRLLVKLETDQPALTGYWDSFSTAIAREGVQIVPIAGGVDGQEEVRQDRYSAYAVIGNEGIQLFASSKQSIESNMIEGMLTAFADRYNLVAAAMKENPQAAHNMIDSSQQENYVQEAALNPDKQPGSIDYYAMAMTTMIALYSIIPACYLFRGETARRTAIRLLASPIRKGELFAGKVIGATSINLMCVLVVVLFSKFAFHADWGNHYGMVFLVLATEVLLAVSLGLGASYLIKGDGVRGVVMIFTQVASFIGGAYFPLGDTSGFFTLLVNLSPLRWANEALTNIIYADNLQAAVPAILLNVGIATAFLTIAILAIRKREAF